MIDAARFWAVAAADRAEGDGAVVETGVAPAAIQAWEAEHGVTLPEPLRSALPLRDGGSVRTTDVTVHPLARIRPVDEDFWRYHSDRDDLIAPNRAQVFEWGHGFATTLLLNFNAAGAHGQPSVHGDHHSESLDALASTLVGFFEALFATDPEPALDWAEAERQRDIVARQSLRLIDPDAGKIQLDQILARTNAGLTLFTRERWRGFACRLTRTTLPLPIDAARATIEPGRPAPQATFALHLQATEPAGVRSAESALAEFGRWRNSATAAVPISFRFEAADRATLAAIRSAILDLRRGP